MFLQQSSFFLGFFLFNIVANGSDLALSFDDAPIADGQYFSGAERTRTLISKLKVTGVNQAIFFCTTKRMDEGGKKRLTAYSDAGHIIANHSHSHFNLHQTDVSTYVEDFQKAHTLLKDFPTFRSWFRFPYLREGKTIEQRDAVRSALTSMGYKNGYVTVDNYDFYMDKLFQDGLKNGKKVNLEALKKVYVRVLLDGILFYDDIGKRILGRSPKHVLLLHENDLAALFVDALIEKLRSSEWRIASGEDAYSDPISNVEPDTLFLNQGRVAAIAKTKGDPGPFWKWEEESELDKLFLDEKVFE